MPITKENYQPNLQMLWTQALIIAEAPIEEMLAALENAESVGPLLDPTLYRNKMHAMAEDKAMLEAMDGVRRAIEKIRKRRG